MSYGQYFSYHGSMDVTPYRGLPGALNLYDKVGILVWDVGLDICRTFKDSELGSRFGLLSQRSSCQDFIWWGIRDRHFENYPHCQCFSGVRKHYLESK